MLKEKFRVNFRLEEPLICMGKFNASDGWRSSNLEPFLLQS